MSNDQITEEQWMSMKETALLLKISYNKLSRLVRQKAIRTQDDVLDQRAKLVEVNEVKRVFRIK
jgi:hypothetical protein